MKQKSHKKRTLFWDINHPGHQIDDETREKIKKILKHIEDKRVLTSNIFNGITFHFIPVFVGVKEKYKGLIIIGKYLYKSGDEEKNINIPNDSLSGYMASKNFTETGIDFYNETEEIVNSNADDVYTNSEMNKMYMVIPSRQ